MPSDRYSSQHKILAFGMILAGSLATQTAYAAPEEIQVYMDELNAPGEVGLDIHTNYVPTGDPGIDYPGAQPSVHRARFTPEFSLGLPGRFEAGFYLPLATVDRKGTASIHGVKARLKWLAPSPSGARGFWGANVEVGYEDEALSINRVKGELKLILGAHLGRWTLASNFNTDFVVSGSQPSPVAFDLDAKIAYAINKHVKIGVESFHGLGDTRSLPDFRNREQTVYLVADAELGRGWGINMGVGRGFAANPDTLIVKGILSVPIGRRRSS